MLEKDLPAPKEQPYKSLYDQYYSSEKSNKLGERPLDYLEGNVSDVLLEITHALNNRESKQSLQLRTTHPHRIIRGILDHKIEHPDKKEVLPLISEAVDLGLAIYKDDPKAVEKVSEFREKVKNVSHGDDSLFTTDVVHEHDDITWISTNPKYSEATASHLARGVREGTAKKDLLLIPLAHGSVGAAMDIFLRYKEKTGSEDSVLFPVRFSTHKKKDEIPQVTEEEIEYLRQVAQGKEIVLFDDDTHAYRGCTLDKAYDFFSTHVFSEEEKTRVLVNKKYASGSDTGN